MKRNFHKNQTGMTLIEIIVAFSITTGAFIAILQAFPTGLSINKRAEMASIASYLAQGKIEEVWSQGYDNIATGTVEVKHRLEDNPLDYFYNFQRETIISYIDGSLLPTDSDEGLKKISSTIYYTDSLSKKEKAYNITTLISQR